MKYAQQIFIGLIASFVCSLSSLASAENPIVKLETSEGDITVLLFADRSPKTVENFLSHVVASM